MRRFALPLVLTLLAVVLTASGCGSSSSNKSASSGAEPAAPSGGSSGADLLSGALTAVQGVKSAHYALDASVTIKTSGQSANPQLAVFTKGPITVHFEGDASSKAFTADGSVGFSGQSFAGKLLLGEHEAYLNLLGQWYGSKSFGLADAQTKGAQSTGTDPQAALKQVRDHFDGVLTGAVSDGPKADGVATTKWEGTLNVDGIAALAKQLGGKEIPAADLDKFRVVATATKIVTLVGKDDKLPRRFELHIALSGDDLAKLGATGTFAGVDSLGIDLTVDLSDYGKQVSYNAPAQFQPFNQLLGAFAGLAGSGG